MLELADRVNAPPAVRLGPSFLVFVIVAQLRFELRFLSRVKTLLFPGGWFSLVWLLRNVDLDPTCELPRCLIAGQTLQGRPRSWRGCCVWGGRWRGWRGSCWWRSASTSRPARRTDCAGALTHGVGWWVDYEWAGGAARIPPVDCKPTALSSPDRPVVVGVQSPPRAKSSLFPAPPPHQAPPRLPPRAAGNRPGCSPDHTQALLLTSAWTFTTFRSHSIHIDKLIGWKNSYISSFFNFLICLLCEWTCVDWLKKKVCEETFWFHIEFVELYSQE